MSISEVDIKAEGELEEGETLGAHNLVDADSLAASLHQASGGGPGYVCCVSSAYASGNRKCTNG